MALSVLLLYAAALLFEERGFRIVVGFVQIVAHAKLTEYQAVVMPSIAPSSARLYF